MHIHSIKTAEVTVLYAKQTASLKMTLISH